MVFLLSKVSFTLMYSSFVLLIFATEEKSFNPQELTDVLSSKKNVNAHILPGKHGFSNLYSQNYDERSAKAAARLVNEFLALTEATERIKQTDEFNE